MVAEIQAFGVQKVHYAQAVASLSASIVNWTGADFIEVLGMTLEPERTFETSGERLGTASLADEIEGKSMGKWSLSFYLRFNGLGVVSDFDVLLTAGFGKKTVIGATSVTYEFDDTIPPPLLHLGVVGGAVSEQAFGAVVEQMDYDVAGNTAGKMTLSGSYARHAFCYTSTLDATVAISDTTLTLQSGEGIRISPGALISFGANDAVVSDVAGDVVTFDPAATAEALAGVIVEGQRPAGASSGTIFNGISCSLGNTLNFDLGFTSSKISAKTGRSLLNDEATSSLASRLGRGKREIAVDLGVYFDAGQAGAEWGRAHNNTLVADWHLDVGPMPGETEKAAFIMPLARTVVGSADIPDAEVATGTIQLVPRMSAAPGDELSLVFSA